MLQTITRKGSFDVCHRVMNERMKCFHVHGHTYLYELTFSFETIESIGYNIDFKEVKRIGCQWIDDILDHGSILNPHDNVLINAVDTLKTKKWLMSLNGAGEYCNPSVENIAKEVFLAMAYLFDGRKGLAMQSIRLYETPNCYTDCTKEAITLGEAANFYAQNTEALELYKQDKGVFEYDSRNV